MRATRALHRAGCNNIEQVKERILDALETQWDAWSWMLYIRNLGPQAADIIKRAMEEPLSSVSIKITDNSKDI